jgi:hypothetical protein
MCPRRGKQQAKIRAHDQEVGRQSTAHLSRASGYLRHKAGCPLTRQRPLKACMPPEPPRRIIQMSSSSNSSSINLGFTSLQAALAEAFPVDSRTNTPHTKEELDQAAQVSHYKFPSEQAAPSV